MAAVRALLAPRLAASALAPRATLHGSAPRPGTRVALVLSGCGVYDGTELHEASAVLVHLSRGGAEVQIFAPDIPQMHVVDHTKGQPSETETRNVLTESARIARGKITDLAKLRTADHDAAIFPGGFGAAKNFHPLRWSRRRSAHIHTVSHTLLAAQGPAFLLGCWEHVRHTRKRLHSPQRRGARPEGVPPGWEAHWLVLYRARPCGQSTWWRRGHRGPRAGGRRQVALCWDRGSHQSLGCQALCEGGDRSPCGPEEQGGHDPGLHVRDSTASRP
nr:glutamine amidotransferase-like class 1 domain-containing protein 3A, mitochondrial isoform X1 [Manis javanica]